MANPTHQVLDHGWVTLRNVAGPNRRTYGIEPGEPRPFDADDVDVAQAARMSFEQMDSSRTYADDLALDKYLWLHKHLGPFEQIVVWLEMKLPIFVARQFVRHRTARLCEVSARYKELPAEYYIPEREHVLLQSSDKKQGGKPADLRIKGQAYAVDAFRLRLGADCGQGYAQYQKAIEAGIAMEQARFHLHVNHYTHWLWQQDLRNLIWFLMLRVDSHAQWESQQYGKAIVVLLEPVLPGLMALWQKAMVTFALDKPHGEIVVKDNGAYGVEWEPGAPARNVGDKVFIVKGEKS